MDDQGAPIEDEEILYRRIPTSMNWFDPELDSRPSPEAFHPNGKRDLTGLSVFRARFVSPVQLAQASHGKRYYIAELRAGDLRQSGIDVLPKPDPEACPGHAELPGLRSSNRRSAEAKEMKVLLAEKLCLRVLGPLP